MASRSKIRAVHAALVLFTLWPLVQIGLCFRYEASPWKLFGFGMYATPRFGLLGMEVFGRRADGSEEQLLAPSPDVQAVAGAYLERVRWLGRLASARELAEGILADHPEWIAVRVVVFRPRIDPETAVVVLTRFETAIPAQASHEGIPKTPH